MVFLVIVIVFSVVILIPSAAGLMGIHAANIAIDRYYYGGARLDVVAIDYLLDHSSVDYEFFGGPGD